MFQVDVLYCIITNPSDTPHPFLIRALAARSFSCNGGGQRVNATNANTQDEPRNAQENKDLTQGES